LYTTYLLSAFFSFSSNSYYGPNAQHAYATTTAAATNDVAATAAATTTATANATTGMVFILNTFFLKLVK
jgi:hypothetical protein